MMGAILSASRRRQATQFFVSNTGSDAADGFTTATAWQTVAKVNSSATAGSVVNFQRGGEWREQLIFPANGITIDAYGSGNKPIINAADPKTTWTSESLGTGYTVTEPSTRLETNGDLTGGTASALPTGWTASLGAVVASYAYDTPVSGKNFITVTLTNNGGAGQICQFWAPFSASTLSATDYTHSFYWQQANGTNWTGMSAQQELNYFNASNGRLSFANTTAAITTTLTKITLSTLAPANTVKAQFSIYFNLDAGRTVSFRMGLFRLEPGTASTLDLSGAPAETIYYTAQATDPLTQVFHNKTRLALSATKAAMTPGTFWWDSVNGRAYVRLSGEANPTGQTMEIGSRTKCIHATGRSGITVKNIRLFGAREMGLEFTNATSNSTIDAVDCDNIYGSGIVLTHWNGADGLPSSEMPDNAIRNCYVAWCTEQGIVVGNRNHRIKIQNNLVENCANYQGPGDGFTAGIRYISDVQWTNGEATVNRADDILIEGNTIRNCNGPTTGERGYGLHVDTPGFRCIVRNNILYGNKKHGMIYEWAEGFGGEVHNNIAYSNGENGILLYRRSRNVVVRNNTCWNNLWNISFVGEWNGETATWGGYRNNVCRDNICFAYTAGGNNLRAIFGGENAGNGSGNVYTRNCLGPQATNFVEWGAGTPLSTYTALDTAYGSAQNNIQSDPLLVNPPTNFGLQAGSPCVGTSTTGGNVGAV